ncbi:hypothetical protein EXIGLDRAFT_747918 [Exidia glandulosa HHB12029]|uniref:Uncharacterized protein n=1 Tax=Exidia glandulosa HHB12029 TaxID=1314781 RepID=A0A165K5U6_EXIGL|nr:hypothetical protein EXIGLDRAFT_747918 [Exidia glandulosa HHB12029]
MRRGNVNAHIKTKTHQGNVSRRAEALEEEVRVVAEMSAQYAFRVRREFDQNGLPVYNDDFWNDDIDMEDNYQPFSAATGSGSHSDNVDADWQQTLFEKALSELCIRSGLDEPEDETVPHNPHDEFETFNDDERDEEEIAAVLRSFKASNGNWSPYGNKTLFLLDLLDNLPRLRLSSSQMRMVLWVMKETGSKDVPSLYALREVQKQLSDAVGIATREFRSSLGNIFSANDIGQLIARDYANPEIGPLLQFYPEEPSGPRSEVWHFDRLKELDPSLLTPMFVAPDGRHYYVNELAELGDGRLVIPYMWIIRGGEMCADAYYVTVQDNVRAADLRRDHPTLLKKGTFSFAESCTDFADAMPNPLRALAGGVPLYTSFINQWADDVSGNKSKQYNKHENVCFTHACVPGRLLQQEYCVHSISTSTHATALEQFEAVHEMIQFV